MKRNQPFARAIAMFNLIAAAMSGPNSQAALAGIGPYVSRGKGQGKNQASRYCAAMQQRAAVKAKNRAKHRAHCRGAR